MEQRRLHFSAHKSDALRAYTRIEAEFEEDGFPLVLLELDEDAGTQEVSVYADGDIAEAMHRITEILSQLGIAAAVEDEALPDVDWVALTLEGLKPVRAGRVFVHGSHDRHKRHAHEIPIEIEAGLAFGTGHHGTTAGCLEVMQRVMLRERPANALDLGTGSAVLAIAMAKLAHIPVLATDIDPVAVRVARDNVRLNGAAALVECQTAAGFHHPVFARRGPFDLIVANILARPLMQLAPAMFAHLTPGGSLVLSGILDRQRDAVIAAYAGQKFRHVRTLHREGWVTIHLKR